MNRDVSRNMAVEARTPLWKSLLLCIPMAGITLLMLSRGRLPAAGAPLFAFSIVFIFFNAVFFMMIFTGKTDRWRALIFVVYSITFVISFISHLIESRGSMALSESNMIEGLTPFCHIVIPMTLIPAALTKTIIFPGPSSGALRRLPACSPSGSAQPFLSVAVSAAGSVFSAGWTKAFLAL